ncbi:hypothetical protein RBB78_22230 [Tunturiibacter empetritectus]|uniref:hypothetical protein n=1 Tax=Tunturiibacter empetritectus TaxID=3069691 RepID=UPI003D9B36C6
MLNNAWPSSIWHLYDYYLDAAGDTTERRKPASLLHVQYSYDDHSVYVVNSIYKAAPGLTAVAHVYDINLKELFSKSTPLDVGPDSSIKAFDIPQEVFQTPSTVYFVQLELKNAKDMVESRNFYWVPAKLTEFDWAKTTYTHTPAKISEDMTALQSLAPSRITATARSAGTMVHLHVSNPSKALAFQIAAELDDVQGAKLPRITWSDNYIELMPGEERDLTALLPSDILSRVELKGKSGLKVKIEGWNLEPVTISSQVTPEKSGSPLLVTKATQDQ